MSTALDAEMALEDARAELATRFAFYGALFASARFDPDPQLETIGIRADEAGLVVRYSPDFILGIQAPHHRVGILIHEANHHLLLHTDRERYGPAAYPDRSALAVAFDLSANEFIDRDLLPPDAIRLERFGLPEGESTRVRYERLAGRFPAGMPEGAHEHAGEQPTSTYENELIEAFCRDAAAACSEDDLLFVPTEVVERIAGGGLGAGGASGTSTQAIERSRPTGVDWRRALREIDPFDAADFIASRMLVPRRYPWLAGVLAGHRLEPERPPRVLVAVDCSGSVQTAQLELAAGAVREIGALADVTVAVFDTKIHAIGPPRRAILSTAIGRAGTDLNAAFDPVLLPRFQALVVVTDGDGPAPATAPRNLLVIWALVGARSDAPAPFGRVVRLQEQGGAS